MKNSLTKKTPSVAKLFNEIASGYDKINSILSMGLDKRWRAKAISFLPQEKGLKILDIACGSCEQILSVAKKRPDCHFTGVDIAADLLEIGRTKLSTTGYHIDDIIEASALDLPFEEDSFSAITLSFGIRNMENVDKALSEAYRVLKKGGKILILEFSLPKGFLQKKVALFYLKHILPKIGNLLSNHSYAYTYLNETIQTFPYGKAFIKHMERAKFQRVTHKPMTFGMVTLYVGEKT